MYGYGYRYNSGLVLGSGGGGAPFANTKSLSFDGVDDFVSTNSKIIGSDITLSGWVNFNGSYSAFSAHFPLSITPSNSSVSNETLGRFYKNGSTLQIAIQCNDNTGGNFSTYFVDNTTLEGAGWQHICITYNVTTKHIYAYLNGVAQNWIKIFAASTPVPFLTAVSGRIYESDLTIGRVNPATSTGTFLGLVDEVSTYNKILTQSEITSISAAPSDLTSLSPTNWYRNGDNGAWKSPQWLIPNNENFAANKVSNYSFAFDGVDDYVDCGVITALQSVSQYSLSCWFKTSNNTKSQGILKWWSSNTQWIEISYVNDVMYFIPVGLSALGTKSITLSNNVWYNVTMVFNGTLTDNTNRLKAYINGVELPLTYTGTVPSITTAMSTRTFRIGQRYIAQDYFLGNIDEASIYDYALSPAEVLTIGGTVPTDLSLLSTPPTNYYKMGEDATFTGGVWTVPDAVGSNNGTSNAMTIEDRVGEAPNSENNAVSYNMDEVDRVEDTP